MTALTPAQQAYVERRRRQIRYWPVAAILLVAVLLALYAVIHVQQPLALDPFLLVAQWQAGKVDEVLLVQLAALGHLAFLGCGLLILMLIVFASLALWSEHRLIRLLDQLQASPGPDDTHD